MTERAAGAGVQMRAAAGAEARAELVLFGDVGWEITPAAVAAAMKGLGKAEPLTVRVNSFGGSAFDGIAIHNMLARHQGEKTVIVEGVAASAASLIAMAGDRIVMPENAMLMIHNAAGGVLGGAEDMRRYAGLLDSISAAYRATYAARTGRGEDEIKDLMDAETWMTAAQAVELGFATETAPPAEVRAVASALAGEFRRMPEAARALLREIPAASRPASTPPAVPPAPTEEVYVTHQDTLAGGQPATPEAPVAAAVAEPQAAARPQAATLEQVEGVARAANLGAEWTLEQIRARRTLDEVRDAAIAALAAGSPQRPASVVVIRDERDTFRARAAAGLLARLSGDRSPAPEAREFAAMGLHGLMREVLAQAGVPGVHRLAGDALWSRVVAMGGGQHSTSDFPIILRDATNKRLQAAFAEWPATWAPWTQQIDVQDFKEIHSAQIGEAPDLEDVQEGGPITYGTFAEEGESYRVRTKGRIISLTREAIINDDLNAFDRVIRGMAQAGYRVLADAVYSILTTNAAMADGKPLFHADHGNIGAGASGTIYHYLVAPDRPTVEIAYLAGRRTPEVTSEEQFNVLGVSYRCIFDFGCKAVSWRGMTRERAAVNPDGSTVAALETLLMTMRSVGGNRMAPPSRLVLLVPPSEHMAARRLATAVTPDSTANVNIYGDGRLQVVVEPRLA